MSKASRDVVTEIVGPYKIKGTIGAGSFAKVKLAVHTQTGEEVAVKIFDRSRLQKKDEKMVEKEISLLPLPPPDRPPSH
eukprot:tig00021017_g17183.t1